MKSAKRPWVFLIALWLSGIVLLAAPPAQSQIQAPPKPRPTILAFGREYCPMCEYMAKTLDQLKAKYGDQIEVRLLHYDPDAKLFEQYKVVFVPTEVFLDASGKEVYRRTGIFTIYELEKKLKELKLLKN
jgi:thioredoxin 1